MKIRFWFCIQWYRWLIWKHWTVLCLKFFNEMSWCLITTFVILNLRHKYKLFLKIDTTNFYVNLFRKSWSKCLIIFVCFDNNKNILLFTSITNIYSISLLFICTGIIRTGDQSALSWNMLVTIRIFKNLFIFLFVFNNQNKICILHHLNIIKS